MIKLTTDEFQKLSKEDRKTSFCGFLKNSKNGFDCYLKGRDEIEYHSQLSKFSVDIMHGQQPEEKEGVELTIEQIELIKKLFSGSDLKVKEINNILKAVLEHLELKI